MTDSSNVIDALVELAGGVRKVDTEEGARYYGQPIGTIIKTDQRGDKGPRTVKRKPVQGRAQGTPVAPPAPAPASTGGTTTPRPGPSVKKSIPAGPDTTTIAVGPNRLNIPKGSVVWKYKNKDVYVVKTPAGRYLILSPDGMVESKFTNYDKLIKNALKDGTIHPHVDDSQTYDGEPIRPAKFKDIKVPKKSQIVESNRRGDEIVDPDLSDPEVGDPTRIFNNLSQILDSVKVVSFKNQQARQKALDYYQKLGIISAKGGLLADLFVVEGFESNASTAQDKKRKGNAAPRKK